LGGGILEGRGFGIDDEVSVFGDVELALFAGEVGDFAFGGLRVEAFDIALLAGFVAGLDEDLEEVVAENVAGDLAEFGARGDGGDEGDDALVGENFCCLGDAADVFRSVLVAEAEVRVESGAEVVAIEDDGEAAVLVELAFDGVGDGGLAGAGEAVEPDHGAALAEQAFLVLAFEEAVEFGEEHAGGGRKVESRKRKIEMKRKRRSTKS